MGAELNAGTGKETTSVHSRVLDHHLPRALEVIERFHAARYVPANVVVAAAGSVDHDALVALVSEGLPDGPGSAAKSPAAPAQLVPRVRFERKATEQYHACLGGPGIPRDDD